VPAAEWKELTVPLTNLSDDPVDLHLSFTNPGKQHLINVNWFRFDR
jgi:hypothetical protein